MNEDLERCHDELDAVKEENEHLREAANAFGALAERLRDQLEVERRNNAGDRRAHPRKTPDRRQDPSGAPEMK